MNEVFLESRKLKVYRQRFINFLFAHSPQIQTVETFCFEWFKNQNKFSIQHFIVLFVQRMCSAQVFFISFIYCFTILIFLSVPVNLF